jgi:hypothetical protein
MLISLHFLSFPSLMVHFSLCSFNTVLYKSLNENISDHVGIRAVVFNLNFLLLMLTRSKFKQGEGNLKTFNPEFGCVYRRKKMAEEENHDEQEKNFHMVFYRMSEMVKRMYGDYEKRMKKKGKKKEAHADDDASVNQGVGGDPLEPLSSPLSSSSSSSEHSHHSHHSSHKAFFKKPLLNLDVKFVLPMFNGDVNPEKIDNWIQWVEVYCHVQHIDEEEVKVQLASLQLEGTTLIWWERKLRDKIKCGNLLSS